MHDAKPPSSKVLGLEMRPNVAVKSFLEMSALTILEAAARHPMLRTVLTLDDSAANTL
jgi:hypothetical protein